MSLSNPPWPRWYRPPALRTTKAKSTRASDLIETVCELTQVTPFEFHGEQRFKAAARARHAVAYVLARHRPDMSLSQIAKATSRKCHSTISNSVSKAKALRKVDSQFAHLVTKLEASMWQEA